MLPVPLHPSIVHFPIVLGLVLPILAALALWRMHDGAPVRTWGGAALVAVLTFGAGFVAARTGHSEEERVEDVLASEEPIHEHEEAADLFLIVSGITAGLAIVGFVPGTVGRAARLLALLGAVAGGGTIARTGFLGGELVYRHGAAAAYTTNQDGSAPQAAPVGDEHEEDADR